MRVFYTAEKLRPRPPRSRSVTRPAAQPVFYGTEGLEDGSLVERDRGTPQGSSISPLLANMFMHYAFDAWMAREHPTIRFERYCDDVIVHARSEQHRLLQGLHAARLSRARVVRFLGVHVLPAAAAEQVWRTVRQLPPGGFRRRTQAHRAGNPPLRFYERRGAKLPRRLTRSSAPTVPSLRVLVQCRSPVRGRSALARTRRAVARSRLRGAEVPAGRSPERWRDRCPLGSADPGPHAADGPCYCEMSLRKRSLRRRRSPAGI